MLWRVSRGGAEAWILGVPLETTQNVWRGEVIERTVSEASQVYLPPQIQLGLGQALGLILSGGPHLPPGETLESLGGPTFWSRFQEVTRKAGLRPQRYRTMHPAWAALWLQLDSFQSRRLTTPIVRVRAMAKAHHVRFATTGSYNGGPMIRAIEKIPPADAMACLREAIDDLDFSLGHLGAATDAWEQGDLTKMAANYRSRSAINCIADEAHLGDAVEKSVADLSNDVEKAASNERAPLFVLNITSLTKEGSVLASLKAHGFTIETPSS